MAADRDHFEGSLAWLAVAAGMASLATIALVWQVLRTGAWRPGRAAWGGALVFAGEDVQLGGGVGMGLRESDAELKGKFDAAIQSMKDDGTLNAMITKWFGDKAMVW